eukprot:758184-Hanusia_phi.AAC.18
MENFTSKLTEAVVPGKEVTTMKKRFMERFKPCGKRCINKAAARLNYKILLERDRLIARVIYAVKCKQHAISNPSKDGGPSLMHAKKNAKKMNGPEDDLVTIKEPFTEKQFAKVKLMVEKFVDSLM